MNVKRCKTRGLALLAIVACAPAFATDADPPVKIGVLAPRGAEKCLEQWRPTAEYLTEQIPERSFVIVPLDFEEICPTVERREVDFVLANPSFYVELEARYGAHRLATMKHRCMGAACTSYGGLIFCLAERTDIADLADLKAKRLVAVHETSFFGWQAAWREMKEAGIDPWRDLAALSFSGTHDAVVLAVRDGLADVGVARSDTLERMAAESVIRLEDFKIIDEQPLREGEAPCRRSTRLYPGWPMAEVVHTSDEFAEAVAIALLRMPADSPAASVAGCAGWTVPHNYQPVHECLKELRIGPYKDLGRITLGAMARQHWPALLAALGFLMLSAFTTSYVLRLNGRLRKSIAAERKELAGRRRVEQALRESEQKLAGIVGSVTDHMAMMDEDHTIVWANAAAGRLFGSDLVGAKCYAAYHRRANPCESCVVRDTFADGKVHEHETDVITSDGKRVVFWCTANVAGWYPDGRPRLVVELSRDITERKQAEAALRESEETVRALLNATTDVVLLIDANGVTLAANEALAQRIGRTVDELIGRCIYDFFPPEVAELRKAKGDEVCRTGKPVRHVDEHAGNYWDYVVHPLFDAEGHVDRLAIFARNITEKRHAEAALAESEARYRALFEQAPDSIVLVEAQSGSLAEFNDRACENLGYTRAEFQNLTVGDIEAIESPDQVVAHTRKIIRDGGDVFETKHRTKTGEIRDALVTSRGVSIGGRDFALAIWRDMTERKRIEDELRKFKTILDSANYGAAIAELDGNLTYVNNAFAAMHGLTSTDLIGRNLSVFHSNEQLPRVTGLNRRLKNEGGYSAEEVWHKRADGSIFPTLMSASVIVDETGGPSFLAATAIDISELKGAEQAVRESEAKYRQLFATVSDAIVVFDAETLQFVDVNDAGLELYGYGKEEFLKSTLLGITAEPERSSDSVEQALAGGLNRIPLRYHMKKNGTVFPVEISVSEFTLRARRVLCGVIRDITERKRAEDVLRRQALVFENMFDAVVVTDTEHRITEWNPAAVGIFGYTRDEAIGKTTQILLRPEDQPERFRQITGAIERDGHWSGVSPFGRKDGSQGHCEATIVALRDEKSRWIGNVAVVHDISERVRAEQEAERRQSELAHVARLATMGEMATGLAHELNQPLSAILHYAHGCRRRLRAGNFDTEETLSVTEKIAAQAERAAAFLNGIRAFVRKGELRLAPVDLNQVVREAASFAAHQARESGVAIDFRLATPLPSVPADMIQIEQVVLNVLRNGIEAMQTTDPSRRRLTIQTSRDGDAVVCAITDTGCGYSDEAAEQLFDAFFTTKKAGMGMGLAISRSIIAAHGGRIWATPNPRGGTTFQFTLPVCEAGANA